MDHTLADISLSSEPYSLSNDGQAALFQGDSPASPDGLYTMAVDLTATGPVKFAVGGSNFTLSAGQSATVTVNDTNQPDVALIQQGWNQPWHLWQPNGVNTLVGEAFARQIEPFQVLRYMDKLKINKSNIVSVSDLGAYPRKSYSDVWPYELVRDVALATNTHAWVNIPALADDTLVAHIANIFKNLPQVRYEHSNEIWNDAFTQYYSIMAYSLLPAGPAANIDGHGRRAAQVAAIISSIDPDAINVLGSQNANPGRTQDIVDAVILETGGPFPFDEIAVAPYIGGTINENKATFDGAPMADWIAAWTAEQVTVFGWAQANATIALANGAELVAYEAGSHVTPLNTDTDGNGPDDWDEAHWVAQAHQFNYLSDQFGLHRAYMRGWDNLTNTGLFVYFNAAYTPTKFGSWGLQTRLDEATPRRMGLFAGKVDFNNDGFIDNGDVNMFVALFIAGDPVTDLNGDGFVDNADIGFFILWYAVAT